MQGNSTIYKHKIWIIFFFWVSSKNNNNNNKKNDPTEMILWQKWPWRPEEEQTSERCL